jgi:hypothetical protein
MRRHEYIAIYGKLSTHHPFVLLGIAANIHEAQEIKDEYRNAYNGDILFYIDVATPIQIAYESAVAFGHLFEALLGRRTKVVLCNLTELNTLYVHE